MTIKCALCGITLFLVNLPLHAQQDQNQDYEFLKLEVEILLNYAADQSKGRAMLDSAAHYAARNDFDLAVIFLEEARELAAVKEKRDNKNNPIKNLKINLRTGIDYNRQEFELGYQESDSVLLDEVNKPFLGIDLNYTTDNQLLTLGYNGKYDKENLQNNIYLQSGLQNSYMNMAFKSGYIIDKNFVYNALGYGEVYADFSLKSPEYSPDVYWMVKNLTRLKQFENPSATIPDFFRNTFSAYALYSPTISNSFQLDYNFDINESLRYKNNDFLEHDAGLGLKKTFLKYFRLNNEVRYRYSDFNYLVSDNAGDSSFTNTSATYSFLPELTIGQGETIGLRINYKADLKSYHIKTEQEPDYTAQFINPAVVWEVDDLTSISLGYIYESRIHKAAASLQEQYVKDQDYLSNGFSATLDFLTTSGILLSLNSEYTRRRYPNFSDELDFSIYANRNIISILAFAQVPLSPQLNINAIVSYDNDKDLDSDFNDSVTSFYTLELSYTY